MTPLRGAFLKRDGIPWWTIRTYRHMRREFPVLFSQPRFQHLELFELNLHAQAVAPLNREDKARATTMGVTHEKIVMRTPPLGQVGLNVRTFD